MILKSKNTIVSIILFLLSNFLVYTILNNYFLGFENSTIFEFLIYTALLPGVICFFSVFGVGFIYKMYRLVATYAFIYATSISLVANIIILKNIQNIDIQKMIENTPKSSSLTITVSEPGFALGNILTSIFLYAVIGALGGSLSVKIVKNVKILEKYVDKRVV